MCSRASRNYRNCMIFCNRRREIAKIYNEAFRDIEHIKIPFESKNCNSNFHLYVLLINFERIGTERAQLMIELKKRGIQTQVHYIPVYTQPFYQKKFGTRWGDCPNCGRILSKVHLNPPLPNYV